MEDVTDLKVNGSSTQFGRESRGLLVIVVRHCGCSPSLIVTRVPSVCHGNNSLYSRSKNLTGVYVLLTLKISQSSRSYTPQDTVFPSTVWQYGFVVTVWPVLHKIFLWTPVVLFVSVHFRSLDPVNDLGMYKTVWDNRMQGVTRLEVNGSALSSEGIQQGYLSLLCDTVCVPHVWSLQYP